VTHADRQGGQKQPTAEAKVKIEKKNSVRYPARRAEISDRKATEQLLMGTNQQERENENRKKTEVMIVM
jgi:hypothetical protein